MIVSIPRPSITYARKKQTNKQNNKTNNKKQKQTQTKKKQQQQHVRNLKPDTPCMRY